MDLALAKIMKVFILCNCRELLTFIKILVVSGDDDSSLLTSFGYSSSGSRAIKVKNPWEVDAVADALCSAIIMIDFVKQLRHGSNTVATLVQIMWHHIGVFTWVGEVWVIGSFPFLLLFRKLLWENCWRSSNKAIFLWVSGLHRVRDLGVALSEHGYLTSWQTIVLQADMIDMINAWLARNWLWFWT